MNVAKLLIINSLPGLDVVSELVYYVILTVVRPLRI